MAKKEFSTELRLLLAFALSFVVLMGSRYLLPKAAPPPAKPAAQQPATSPSPQPAAQIGSLATPPAKSPARETTPPSAPMAAGTKQGAAEQEITADSELYQIVFSTRGGVVKTWSLKSFRDDKGNPLDLVDHDAAQQFGYPLSISPADAALRELNSALFVPSASGAIHAPGSLTLEYSNGRIAVRKEITFTAKSYVVEVKTDVWSEGKAVAHQIAWPGGFGDIHDIGMRGNVIDVYYRDPQKITRQTAGDIKTGELSLSGAFEYAGLEDRFFAGTFFPTSSGLRLTAFRQDVPIAGQSKPRESVGLGVQNPDAPQNHMRLFVGPKETDLLASVHPHLPDLVDYGWFAIVAKPLFVALRWIHDHVVGNYGWAIILLTIVINFLLFPLKLKSLRSTMKMQRIQPQIRAIQEKYKQYKMKDPRKQEMNREMMDLYKQHGVNPVGGCLPMLIQIPFLYGFYKVLVVSIEMRHAPWILWVHDLSAPEHLPVKVLPLAMCITQFILQKMSPSPSPDPAQQKIMLLMPVMFLFMFWGLSSGLVLYWLTGNVVSIAQQWYINRTEMYPAKDKQKALRGGKKQVALRK